MGMDTMRIVAAVPHARFPAVQEQLAYLVDTD